MRAIDPAYEEKIIPQIQTNLEGLKNGFEHRNGPNVCGTKGKPEGELDRKKRRNQPKTFFN